MKFCEFCNKTYPDKANFCASCGNELIDDQICKNCLAEIKIGYRHCPQCGKNLQEPPFATSRPVRELQSRSSVRHELFRTNLENLPNPSKGVTCPDCGRPAKLRPCFVCSSPVRGSPQLVSKAQCPYCKGKGVVIHCEPCSTRRMQQQAAAATRVDQKALQKNPFLPYYDKRFRKYRK